MKFDILTRLPVTACEDDDHRFAGHCTEECARLVENMLTDGYYEENMIYSDYLGGESSIDWSGCHAGPIMPEEAVEYDEKNRAVIVVMVHPEGCQCPAHEDEYEDEDPAYMEFLAAMERMCGRSVTFGGSDPYGATCELDTGHAGRHRSRNPFSGDGFYEWTGGGVCAGDPLPYQGEFVDE